MIISKKQTDYSQFTWFRQRHATLNIESRRTGIRYFWYPLDGGGKGSWHRAAFQFNLAAEAVVYDPRDFSRTTPV